MEWVSNGLARFTTVFYLTDMSIRYQTLNLELRVYPEYNLNLIVKSAAENKGPPIERGDL